MTLINYLLLVRVRELLNADFISASVLNQPRIYDEMKRPDLSPTKLHVDLSTSFEVCQILKVSVINYWART